MLLVHSITKVTSNCPATPVKLYHYNFEVLQSHNKMMKDKRNKKQSLKLFTRLNSPSCSTYYQKDLGTLFKLPNLHKSILVIWTKSLGPRVSTI